MFPYFATFLAALISDSLPVIGPPVWMILVFMHQKFDLNPWLVLFVGVPASVLGRYGLSLYSGGFIRQFITKSKSDEMAFVGRRLNGNIWKTWPFVLLYSLLPLSSTALFFAAGLARVKPIHVLPPFFVGKFVSDAIMLFSSGYAIQHMSQVGSDLLSWKSLTIILTGLLLIAAFLFLDWRRVLEHKQVRFKFHIWR